MDATALRREKRDVTRYQGGEAAGYVEYERENG